MTTNSIDAWVEFSYQGKDHHYLDRIDLDQLLCIYDELPSIHELLAKCHQVDTYSYLYEVMLEAELEFANPTGSAADYLVEGCFDVASLADNWHKAKVVVLMQPVVERELGIKDLRAEPALCRALLAAYNMGRSV
ncbi:MAG: hypothetical protein WC208_04080 [Gallionella sp.]|jgi:hypothetical protein